MMEWRQDASSDCPGHRIFCIKYPVRKLQQYDTEFGFDFHVSLFVYNKAGHYLKIDTDVFRLPSRYAPGNAAVLDVDPRDKGHVSDVDVHFTDETLCATWTGFRHHENITLEFAVSSGTQTDDVIPFKVIENVQFTCINSSKLLPGVKYHALLRATCSGGQTVSASNGVTILTQSYVDKYLKVHVGEDCFPYPNASIDLNFQSILNLTKPLRIGHVYHIYAPANASVELKNGSGSINMMQSQELGQYYNLVPFVQRPFIQIVTANNSVDTDMIKIVQCQSKIHIPVTKLFVESHWHFTTGNNFSVNFEVGIMNQGMKTSGLLTGFVRSSNLTRSRIQIPHSATPGLQYRIAVRTCLRTSCLEPVMSQNFTFLFNVPDGHISVADIEHEDGRQCLNVDLQWDAFKSDSPIMFYQWSLSEDSLGRRPVAVWTTIENTSTLQYQVRVKTSYIAYTVREPAWVAQWYSIRLWYGRSRVRLPGSSHTKDFKNGRNGFPLWCSGIKG